MLVIYWTIVNLVIHQSQGTDDCKFRVKDRSAEYFKKWLKIMDGMLAYLDIEFEPHLNYSATADVISPTRWTWTFVPPGGGQFYIAWPAEYFVYSFGLLDTQTLKETVKLYINVSSPKCNVTFGEMNTVKKLGHAFYEMLEAHNFDKVNAFYDYSYWCYLAADNNMYGSTRYHLSRYLGAPFQLFGYKCCNTNKEQREGVKCYPDILSWHSSQFFPFIVGVLFFAYFPLFVVKYGHRAVKYGTILNTHQDWQIDNDEDQYIFWKKSGPVTVTRLVLSVFGLAQKHPLLASRVRRAVFVLFSPILVYIFIYIFHTNGKTLVTTIIKHKIPFGFMSVVGGFKESMNSFLPMFGGPVISLCLYTVVGFVLLLPPRQVVDILKHGLPRGQTNFSTLLNMDIKTIEMYSKVKCEYPCGYRRVYSTMKGSLCMFANPSFWKFVVLFIYRRWHSLGCRSFVREYGRCRCVIFTLYFPILLLYIAASILEIVLLILYKGFPICFFVVCSIRGFPKCIRSAQRGQTFFCSLFSSVVFPLLYIFFIFMQTMITLQSFIMVGYFLFCLYLSLNLFPSRAFGFVYFFIMFFIYVNSLFKEFEQEYRDILHYTIKACKKLEKLALAKNIRQNGNKNDIIFLMMTKNLPTEFTGPLLSIQYSEQEKYLHYKEQIPGVRKDLFRFVTDRCRPVFLSASCLFAQICVVQVLVLLSVVFIARYIRNIASAESSEVLNVVSVVCVTMIPNIMRHFFSKTHEGSVRRRKVRQHVIEFWQNQLRTIIHD